MIYVIHLRTPNSNLINIYKEYFNESITGLIASYDKDCIIKSAKEALCGEEVTDKSILQRNEAKKKAKVQGLTDLNKKNRKEYEILTKEDIEEVKRFKQNK
ncbi:MAG: hypothetical protein WCG23_10280 [bacterium]